MLSFHSPSVYFFLFHKLPTRFLLRVGVTISLTYSSTVSIIIMPLTKLNHPPLLITLNNRGHTRVPLPSLSWRVWVVTLPNFIFFFLPNGGDSYEKEKEKERRFFTHFDSSELTWLKSNNTHSSNSLSRHVPFSVTHFLLQPLFSLFFFRKS